MAQTPARLAAVALTTVANTAVYTVPAGKTAIVKQVMLGGNSAALPVSLAVNGVQFANAMSVAANGLSIIDMSLVLAAGDVLQAWSTSTAINIVISGVVSP